MKTKKLLAIVLSLALLIGLMPAAGLLMGTVAAEETDPTVYEIKFDAGEKVDLGYYVASGHYTTSESDGTTTYTTVYDVSFEYYLDCETEGALAFSYKGLSGGSSTLTKGLHSVNFQVTRATTDKNNAFTPWYIAGDDLAVDCTLYAWNLVVKANDQVIPYYTHGPWQCTGIYNGKTHTCTRTTAAVTSDKTLSTYPFVPNADGSVKKLPVYVDQTNGSDDDTTNDGTEELPYASLYKAMTEIEGSLYLEGEIVIKGDYTNANRYELYKEKSDSYYVSPTSTKTESPDYTKPVTIRGAEGKGTNHLYTTENSMWIFGPTTFDDITIQQTASAAGSCTFQGRHNEVTFGSNAELKGTIGLIAGRSAPVYHALPTKQAVVILNTASTFNTVELGNINSTTSTSRKSSKTILGVTYVQNVGSVYNIRVGSHGNNSENNGGGDIYTGDVNVIINAGTVGKSSDTATGILLDTGMYNDTHKTDYGDNAVQIIFNNGTGLASDSHAMPTVEEIRALNGNLYVLKAAADGSQLAVTDTAGKYTVADSNYIAVAKDADGNEVTRSVDGVLDLTGEGAGTYTVEWEVAETFSVYVDDSGDDSNNGTSSAPYKTLLTAVQAIVASNAKAGVINVVNTLTTPNGYAMSTATNINNMKQMHEIPITIQGVNGTDSQLVITDSSNTDLLFYGDVTIDNITVNGSSGYNLFANKHHITIGADAVINDKPYIYVGFYNGNNGSVDKAPTEPTCLTLNGNSYKRIGIGGIYTHTNSYSEAGRFAGINVVLNEATVSEVHVGHIGNSNNQGGNIYTDNVNVTVNGGTVTTLKLGDVNNNSFPTTFVNNALQLILNDGAAMPSVEYGNLMEATSAEEAVAKMDGVLYVMKGAEGVSLEATETAGVYKVEEGKIAVAKNGETVVAVSRDGCLTVPAGTYDVSYVDTEPYIYDADNRTVTVNKNVPVTVTVDFAGMPHKEIDGKVFTGYVDADGNAATATLTAGTVLTAQYVDKNFTMKGAALRKPTGDKKQALRFIVQLSRELKDLPNATYGTVLLPNEILFIDELALGNTYMNDNGSIVTMFDAASVPVVRDSVSGDEKLYRDVEDESFVQYTAAMINIPVKNYLTAYAARGYLTYTDLNGVSRTVYTDKTDAASLNEVAEILIEEADKAADVDETLVAIVAAAKAYAEEQIADTKDDLTSANAADRLYGDAELTFKVGDNGVYTTADGREVKYTSNKANGLVVREITIDTFGDNANEGETVIAQLTDLHLNYANDEDMSNEYTKYSWENRLNMNSWNLEGGEHVSVSWHEQALKYATAISDQVVITGDMMDYYSLGNMQLVDRIITQPYSNALMLVGNHDIDSVVCDSGSENPPVDEYYENDTTAYYDKVQTVWTNDVYYTSKLVGKEVLVIQMDNGRDTFREDQIACLTNDLKLARKNGYTVLLFMHIPLEWESAELLYGDNLNANCIDGTESDANEKMLQLIKSNGDVIRGIFAGHVHDDIYSAIPATYVENDVTKSTTIPQFTLRGGFVAGGNVLKITVE